MRRPIGIGRTFARRPNAVGGCASMDSAARDAGADHDYLTTAELAELRELWERGLETPEQRRRLRIHHGLDPDVTCVMPAPPSPAPLTARESERFDALAAHIEAAARAPLAATSEAEAERYRGLRERVREPQKTQARITTRARARARVGRRPRASKRTPASTVRTLARGRTPRAARCSRPASSRRADDDGGGEP